MKKHWLAFLLTLALIPAFTGCVGTVDDGSKAGLPFSQDTIESRYPRSIDQLTVATREVLARNGTITSDDAVTRVMRAKVTTSASNSKVKPLRSRAHGTST